VRVAGSQQRPVQYIQQRLCRCGRPGGTRPADHVHDPVVEVAREVGIDLSDRVPREITTDELRSCDYVATMGCSTLDVGEAPDQVRRIRDEIEQAGRLSA